MLTNIFAYAKILCEEPVFLNFLCYSEVLFAAGKTAAEGARGIPLARIVALAEHFARNKTETYCPDPDPIVSERALRDCSV